MEHFKTGNNSPSQAGRLPGAGARSRRLSEEKLFALRRLRKARRLWKQEPLFAFANMALAYPGYTYAQFLKDLTRRGPRKNKKSAKTPLCRYGRYSKMKELLARFHNTVDVQAGRAAMTMRKNMTRPYRMRVQLAGACYEYTLSPMIPYAAVEALNREVGKATTWHQVEQLIDTCRKLAASGG